jgi:hypothetical protein
MACFTDDAVYVRPSLNRPGLEFMRGRDELEAFFVARGKQPHRHLVVESAVSGKLCFIEGAAGIEGKPPTHTFLVSATVESDGRISRYFALMAETTETR